MSSPRLVTWSRPRKTANCSMLGMRCKPAGLGPMNIVSSLAQDSLKWGKASSTHSLLMQWALCTGRLHRKVLLGSLAALAATLPLVMVRVLI